MYSQIENEFKDKSKLRLSQILFVMYTIIFSILCMFFLWKIIELPDICIVFFIVVAIVVFFMGCYIFMFFKAITKKQRSIKIFLKVFTILNEYDKKIHDDDIKILRDILKKHNIDSQYKMEEAIRHYQCILPRRVSQSGITLSIFSIVVAVIALFTNETIIASSENIVFLIAFLLIAIMILIILSLIVDCVYRFFGRDALYIRLEDSLSEIFMQEYIKNTEEL